MRLFKEGGQVDIIRLIVILAIIGFIGGLPVWGYSHSWGPWPSGFFGFILFLAVLRAFSII